MGFVNIEAEERERPELHLHRMMEKKRENYIDP